MSDRNLISINSTPDGKILVNGVETDAPGRVIEFDELVPGPGMSDTLKFSGVEDVAVRVRRLVGGVEDCIDVNNKCRNVVVYVEELVPTGRYAATIKGESEHVTIIVNRLVGHGKETDFDYGNRSEQASGRTKNCTLRVTEADGPVRVRVMHAWRPELGGAVKFKVNTTLKGWISYLFRFFPLIFGK